MGAANPTSYDSMPYQGAFIPSTHPDRMAVMGLLYGMNPPHVERCRVLELGCCDGGNLLTIAQTLPDATLVGIDLSPRQVADGQAKARAIGADNVHLRALDLSEADESFGLFDYIICHGVYSWVPAEIRSRILQLCGRNLAPNGLAYISYNTYPGWRLRGMIREIMRYHTAGIAEPDERVRQARAVVDFVVRSTPSQDGPHALLLRQELEKLDHCADTYLFHEYLEEDNDPLYFHEFAALANAANLHYVSQSFFSIEECLLPSEARQVLSGLGSDLIRREQYIDFLLNRAFRQSLLCHAGTSTTTAPFADALRSLRMTSKSRPEDEAPEIDSDQKVPFLTLDRTRVLVDEPLLKAALIVLWKLWPRSARFSELWDASFELLGRPSNSLGVDHAAFASSLLQAHMMRLLELHSFDPPIATEVGERPRAGAMARRDAASGARVISLRNHFCTLEEIDRRVLPLLDGNRDRDAVADDLARLIEAGGCDLKSDEETIGEIPSDRRSLDEAVRSSLERIAGQALLIADSREP
jgi:cyclopropane fatty-acyl-phospholipid synthase-like methyltransferase